MISQKCWNWTSFKGIPFLLSNISNFNNASSFPAVGNSHSQFAQPVSGTGTDRVILQLKLNEFQPL